MKTVIRATLLVVFLCFAAKADTLSTWDFSFTSVGGQYTGSGSFQATGPGSGVFDFDTIVSLDGDLNGQAMTLEPGSLLNNATDSFLDSALLFSAGGDNFMIWDNDFGAPSGNDIQDLSNGMGAVSIDLTLVDPPTPTPEPPAIALLLVGLVALGALGALKRTRGKAASVRTLA